MIDRKAKKCSGIGKAQGIKGCGEPTLYRTFGLCNNCLSDFLFKNEKGKLIFEKSILPKAKIKNASENKKKTREAKEKLKTLGQYEAAAKKSFQKYIRLRDSNLPCISCGANDKDLWDGGHYKKAELYSGVIFDEDNCHKQCRYCNRYLGGNEANYRSGLIVRLGEENVLQLEKRASYSRIYKYTKQELTEIKKKYDLKIKSLYL